MYNRRDINGFYIIYRIFSYLNPSSTLALGQYYSVDNPIAPQSSSESTITELTHPVHPARSPQPCARSMRLGDRFSLLCRTALKLPFQGNPDRDSSRQ